jgi:hypothetical protein
MLPGAVTLLILLITQAVPPALADAQCDSAQFVSDITVPDGASFAPGAAFTKTWRLLNNGSCAWTTSYNLVWVGGELLGAPAALKLPVDVPPGQMLDLSVGLVAPAAGGHYRGLWKLSNAAGLQFGTGELASDAFWVDINVVEVSAVIYDFVANAPYAQWKSDKGVLPYPGASGDSRGFSSAVDRPHLEDDSFDASPGLLTVPQNKYNGYIQAIYPELQIEQGDKLQTLVNCEFGATGCYVTFRIDYLTAAGNQRELWSWKEAYEGRFYRANIDLSRLAGQKVRFVLMLLSTGLASGDRALWGAPRIIRTGSLQPPSPPATLTPLAPLTATATPLDQPPPTIAPSGCDKASFVADITVPDGTLFSPGAAFTKTWRLKNAGGCTWTTAYKFLFYAGEQMGAATSINLPGIVSPGTTVDLTLNMVAPAAAGGYRGFWILSNASGALFGIGLSAADPIWVEINVAGDASLDWGYDFTANACSAQWKSGAGSLPCPGSDGDPNGFVLRQEAPKLEDGTSGAPGLLTAPQSRFDSYIQGMYPTITVQPGDRFQGTAGCEYGISCYVTFRLDTMSATGSINTFWSRREQNERRYANVDVDLSPLAGRSVRFILTILATGSAANDRAIWGSPRIMHANVPPASPSPTAGTATETATLTPSATLTPPGTLTETPTPTVTPTATLTDWITYGFELKYPPEGQISGQTSNYARIDLPFEAGTNLREKYLEAVVVENVNPCHSPLPSLSSELVTINGIPFLKETAAEGGMGHTHQWTTYSTMQGNACVSLDFILHWVYAGNFATPPPVFNEEAEKAVFGEMVSTFAWLAPTSTPSPTATETAPVPSLALVQSVEVQIVESQPLGANAVVRGQLPDSGCTSISSVSQALEGNTIRLTLATTTDPLALCEPVPTAFEQVIALEVGNLPPATYTVNANGIEQSFELLTHDSARFGQAVVDALNAQNYDLVRVLMDQEFGFAFWQSQGFSSPVDLAIEQLKNYIGPGTHLTADPGKDLTALLGGFDPYAIMGLNPATSQALFVSGWGLDGLGEAILYVTRLPDGSLFFDAVLIAPSTFAGP